MDPRLVMLAQQGDEAAFADIAQASNGRLKQVAYRIVRDKDLAEDAMQQALVEIWQALPRLRDPARFDAWSYRFLVRACYREAKRLRDMPPELADRDQPTTPDSTGAVMDRDQLERGFERLSLDHRAVVVMHYYLDLTIEDTADALGISAGTAKSRLNRAMAKMRIAMHVDARAPDEPDREPAV
jgi:RNA polymerase sigma-70 factor (ECF subfamily)